ncbi:hypothetical protein GCK32_005527 [Trichostrongylus colubriformis]|uniref:Uncharacterized protein n=1 Tax=Trichostrongylus colubriformis TaxID=6319 RepID=A0AAN8FHA9_TRICO
MESYSILGKSKFFNYYMLALPVLSTLYLVKAEKRRIKDITENVNVNKHATRASGYDGWTNYYLLIQKQWMSLLL